MALCGVALQRQVSHVSSLDLKSSLHELSEAPVALKSYISVKEVIVTFYSNSLVFQKRKQKPKEIKRLPANQGQNQN